jgi:predicted transcriptional regulator
MIEQLFGSKTRVKLLKLFFSNPNRSFYVREITRKVDEQINSVRRELANLLSLGLIKSDSSNNRLYYEVNQEYEHFKALQSMFSEEAMVDAVASEAAEVEAKATKEKKAAEKEPPADNAETEAEVKTEKKAPVKISETISIIELPEAKHWEKAGNITAIAYSGIYTRDDNASVDILIIGDAVDSKIESIVAVLEKEKNRELRYAVIEPEEWKYRGQVRDKFWLQFMAVKKQIVLDKEDIFNNK